MTAQEISMDQAEYNQLLDDLLQAAQDYDQQALREIMLQAPTGFVPTDGIGDLVWAQARFNKSQTN
ncbi:nucleoside-diphosphate sugar epimerase/dehydratase [Vibrio maritimus]|uniref:Nucleoside-diphosphate sugar epimerase/dehydratase n=1 Tax=Vibrio maritimus TaxID=990268 RepID=A0A090S309_9VIBR|nr:nucleoside-diphosphate sugar epimerase/dehydratase [Vibrio maritimus]